MKKQISSLARGLQILKCFNDDNKKLTLTELSNISGMNKAAVQRYTSTLQDAGFLQRDQNKKFRLGIESLVLGYMASKSSDIGESSYPLMLETFKNINQTINLGIPSKTEVVIIKRIESKKIIHYDLKVGYRLPTYCTSMGKAYLAFLPEKEREEIINMMSFQNFTPHTITDKKTLTKDLEDTRIRGYSILDQELSIYVRAIGAPVLSYKGEIVAAVNIAVNSSDFSREELTESYAKNVVDLSKVISRHLGWTEEN